MKDKKRIDIRRMREKTLERVIEYVEDSYTDMEPRFKVIREIGRRWKVSENHAEQLYDLITMSFERFNTPQAQRQIEAALQLQIQKAIAGIEVQQRAAKELKDHETVVRQRLMLTDRLAKLREDAPEQEVSEDDIADEIMIRLRGKGE